MTNELYHHGIKGQKWYVRRWQNEDGSLTPAGRIHYGYGTINQYKKNPNYFLLDVQEKAKPRLDRLKREEQASIDEYSNKYGISDYEKKEKSLWDRQLSLSGDRFSNDLRISIPAEREYRKVQKEQRKLEKERRKIEKENNYWDSVSKIRKEYREKARDIILEDLKLSYDDDVQQLFDLTKPYDWYDHEVYKDWAEERSKHKKK